ncbi:hypothetical protein KSW81_006993 [Nannochloris sp. 'desiccata']|nr:hypothetical protein KSW81_006993 [Chlorella desiccata (nom. nud.)]
MILRNSFIHNNIDVIAYSRLPSGQSVANCLALCRSNQECYSFNYNKLTKWCYIGTTEETNLRQTRNGKWAAGYRRCVEQINNNPWTNEEFNGGSPSSGPQPVTTLNVVDSVTNNALDVTFVAPTVFGVGDDGVAAIFGSYKVSCTSTTTGAVTTNTFTTGSPITFGGLATQSYICSVVVVNDDGLESTAVVFTPVAVSNT